MQNRNKKGTQNFFGQKQRNPKYLGDSAPPQICPHYEIFKVYHAYFDPKKSIYIMRIIDINLTKNLLNYI